MIYLKTYDTGYLSKDIRGELCIRHCHVCFIPAVTIDCTPPYIAGKMDNCWVSWRTENRPDFTNKEQCERVVGMRLLPLKEE